MATIQTNTLTGAELSRYSRHLLLPEIGMEGQEKLKAASVLVVGAGGLGSPLTMYLAAAGVGRMGIVEFDRVDQTNLQRQILYSDDDTGRPKLDAAAERLHSLNPHISIERHPVRLTRENAREILSGYDLVADGTDNFATRYLVNDACVMEKKPNVYASIFRFDGQVSVFGAPGGPCYRCLYPEPPPPGMVPSCAEGGVLGVLPGILGSLQAAEVIKMITGIGRPLIGRLMLFDALEMEFRTLKARQDPECPVCSEQPTITELIDYDAFCGVPVAKETEVENQTTSPNEFPSVVSAVELKDRMALNPDLFLLDVRMPVEYEMANLGGTLIPLPQLPERLDELESVRDRDIVVMCRSGARSAQAQAFLQANGFERVANLAGGILAWAETVDDSVPRY